MSDIFPAEDTTIIVERAKSMDITARARHFIELEQEYRENGYLRLAVDGTERVSITPRHYLNGNTFYNESKPQFSGQVFGETYQRASVYPQISNQLFKEATQTFVSEIKTMDVTAILDRVYKNDAQTKGGSTDLFVDIIVQTLRDTVTVLAEEPNTQIHIPALLHLFKFHSGDFLNYYEYISDIVTTAISHYGENSIMQSKVDTIQGANTEYSRFVSGHGTDNDATPDKETYIAEIHCPMHNVNSNEMEIFSNMILHLFQNIQDYPGFAGRFVSLSREFRSEIISKEEVQKRIRGSLSKNAINSMQTFVDIILDDDYSEE